MAHVAGPAVSNCYGDFRESVLRKMVTRAFGGPATDESVYTRARFEASVEDVWNSIQFYEEVPGRAPILLRTMLPQPLRTSGNKTQAGEKIHCFYTTGNLLKRITCVEAPYRLQFEVLEQYLGIEDWIIASHGSYELTCAASGVDVVLTTNYRAFLHPRSLWKPFEKLLAGQLHGHILNGIRWSLADRVPAKPAGASSVRAPNPVMQGEPACTASQSPYPL